MIPRISPKPGNPLIDRKHDMQTEEKKKIPKIKKEKKKEKKKEDEEEGKRTTKRATTFARIYVL